MKLHDAIETARYVIQRLEQTPDGSSCIPALKILIDHVSLGALIKEKEEELADLKAKAGMTGRPKPL